MAGDPRAVGLARLLRSRPDLVARLRAQQAERNATEQARIDTEAARVPQEPQEAGSGTGAGNPGTAGAGYRSDNFGLGRLGGPLSTVVSLGSKALGMPVSPLTPYTMLDTIASLGNRLGVVPNYSRFEEPMPEVYQDPRTITMIDPFNQPLNEPLPTLSTFDPIGLNPPDAPPAPPVDDPNTALTLGFVMDDRGNVTRGLAERSNFGRRSDDPDPDPGIQGMPDDDPSEEGLGPGPPGEPGTPTGSPTGDPGDEGGGGPTGGDTGGVAGTTGGGGPSGDASTSGYRRGGTVKDRMRLPRGLERINAHEGEEVTRAAMARKHRPMLKAINADMPRAGLMRLLRRA